MGEETIQLTEKGVEVKRLMSKYKLDHWAALRLYNHREKNGTLNIESHNQTGGITTATATVVPGSRKTSETWEVAKTIQVEDEPKTFEEAVHRTANEIAELVISKQRDYGHGNILAFGTTGILVRMSDKMERMKNLHKKQQEAANEPMLDSLTDMAGYAILALMLDEGTFTLELEEDQK